jgi:uncharacterized protein
MINQNTIEEVKKRLINVYNPLEIYLFGSYAWGHPDEESDLDLLIVIEKYSKDRYSMLLDGHKAFMDMTISKDIVVLDKEEFEKFSEDITRLCYKIKREGKRLYAKA